VSLDPSYLEYPHRKRGYDHDLFGYSALPDRAPVAWPGGKAVAVWITVSLEWFPLAPSDKPFRAPGHMQTPYPDYRHYTARDYGTRVGFYRLLDAFAARGIPVSVATCAAFTERAPQLIRDITGAGHEIIAHPWDMNGTIATGLPEDDERALITRAKTALEQATGARLRGWHSIARSQSFATPRLLAEAGFDYVCDWVNDELPYAMTTPAGPLVNLPLNHELSDRQILTVQQQSVDSYVEQMQDAYAWLAAEAQSGGGRMLPLHITPYIIGLPYRIDAFEQLLDWLDAQPGAWFTRGDMLLDAWRAGQ
jgi:hypothetical protein